MTAPIAPDDTAGLNALYWAETERLLEALPCYRYGSPEYRDHCPNTEEWATINDACMAAVAKALVPPDHTVVRTDDLRAVLDALGRHTGVMDDDGFMLDDEERIVYDRLRGKVDGV